MAITTQMIGNAKEEAGAPEGYEFVKDEKGRISLKKIRSKKEIKAEAKEAKEEVEAPVEEKKSKRGKK